jgi:predicted dehydrogenase
MRLSKYLILKKDTRFYTIYCTLFFIVLSMLFNSCSKSFIKGEIGFVTVDPGHFHAALVHKTMYPEVAKDIYIYGSKGNDLTMHLGRINDYNTRKENPTTWKLNNYDQPDYLSKAFADRKGNVVVLSGNNAQKTDNIYKAIQNGYHVLADKPMIIDKKGYEQLIEAVKLAKKKNVLLYDIMTERFDIATTLQRELSKDKALFGTLLQGSKDDPSIIKESVHHFFKYVSGKVLQRPPWFFDTKQQGEGIVDVNTHLIDLVFWAAYPDQSVHNKDVALIEAKRWPTVISKNRFYEMTSTTSIPDYLSNNLIEDSLHVYANGSIDFKVKDIHARTIVKWNYRAPEGTGDTHYSIMKGSLTNLEIKQGKEENYKPTLYIRNKSEEINLAALNTAILNLSTKYPGIITQKVEGGYKVVIPSTMEEGHEAHFARVTQNFIAYLTGKKSMPNWEMDNLLSKYYLTSQALSSTRK